jgi:hypothetical protein
MINTAPPHRVFDTTHGPVSVFTGAGSVFVSCVGVTSRPDGRPAIVRFTQRHDGCWQLVCPIDDTPQGVMWAAVAAKAVTMAISDGLLDDAAARTWQRTSRLGLPRQQSAPWPAAVRLVPTPTPIQPVSNVATT